MKSSTLKSIIESEMFVGSSEMTQRFQYLRNYGLLPNDKGQAARDLSNDEIVSGILSVLDMRPSYAGLIAKCTKSLLPVRGVTYSYRGARNFGEALCLMLENSEDVIEIKVKGIENDDSGIPPYAYGARAQITCKINSEEKTFYYHPSEVRSNENWEDGINYDPRLFTAPFEREYVLKKDIFRMIGQRLKQEKEYNNIMKMPVA
jgi:hypothetical protein